ncbi:uncharacterized protein [Littorina saxatilis]|uniref:uncharacterized protein n=1 Tax=Littorina saxatilis TaxID=31220 RepID=UPI0038B4D19C
MIIKRSLFGSQAVAEKATTDKTTQASLVATTSPQATEVSRTKISPSGAGDYQGSPFNLYRGLRGSGRHQTHHLDDNFNDHLNAFIGFGFVGAILFIAVCCVIFQYCKSSQRNDSSPPARRRQRSFDGAAAASALGQDVHTAEELGEEEGEAPEPMQVRGDGEAVSDNEISWLNATFREEDPIRYCIVPVQPENKTLVAENTSSHLVSAETHLYNASVNLQSKYVTVELQNWDSESRNIISNDSRNLSPEIAKSNDDVDSPSNDVNILNEDDVSTRNNQELYSPNVLSDLASDVDLSPLTDRISDVSDLLVALVLDVSSTKNDAVTAGMTQHQSDTSCREIDEDSVGSEESFSRLQDVRAQAEFSPYHLAWSTPLLPHRHAAKLRRHSSNPGASTASKKLNMELDMASDKPDPSSLQREAESSVQTLKGLESTQAEPHSSSNRRRMSESSRGSKMSDSSLLRDWGFLKQLADRSKRPASVEWDGRRPSAGSRRRSLGAWSDVSAGAQIPGPEGSPLLPYSVVEYRRSLKNIIQAEDVPRIVLEPSKTPEAEAESPSLPLSSPRSYLSPLQSGFAVYNSPRIDIAWYAENRHCQEWDDQDHTPQNRHRECGIGLRQCSVIKENDNNTAVLETNTQDHTAVGRTYDTLNNNKSDIVVVDTIISSPHINAVPTFVPFSSPSLSYTGSSEVTSPSGKSTDVSPEFMSTKDSSASSSNISETRGTFTDPDSGMSPGRQPSSDGTKCAGSSYEVFTPEYRRGMEAGSVHLFNSDGTPSTASSPSSKPRQMSSDLSTFKTPFPVDNLRPNPSASRRTPTGVPRPIIPRSRSSVNKPLSQQGLHEESQPPLRRSRTSDSVSSSTPINVGSLSDVSVVGFCASRLSLQNNSMFWDDEFSAPAPRGENDSLAWEDDPFLD